ncbi:hypothetical protein DOY81_011727 [Sarcophaga bullata]|nr:hypothetical protein DOY81_011727 [Sarcophaga bullata]
MSPSSSYHSASRLSAASPTSSVASPTMSLTLEADHHSRDSGVASGSIPCNNNRNQLSAVSLVDMSHQAVFPTSDEMPTDLSVSQIIMPKSNMLHNKCNNNNNNKHQYILLTLSKSPSSPQQHHHQQTAHNSSSNSIII